MAIRRSLIGALSLLALSATAASAVTLTAPLTSAWKGSSGAVASRTLPARDVQHPGSAPWERVPRAKVAKECGLSPKLMEAAEPAMSLSPYAVIRYGRLCWAGGGEEGLSERHQVNSATKTFAALLFGIVASRTDVNEDTYVRDWVTPGEMNVDAGATAMTQPALNPDAKIFHLLTSTGHNPLLGYGQRLPWSYDATGVRGMNSIIRIIDKVVQANPDAFPGSRSARDLAFNELFEPLGMTSTDWPGLVASHTLESTVYDMAKLGELLLRKGRWGDRQIVDEDYVYRMTHPQIEDVHTGYGYLTWLNAAAGVAPLFDIKTDPTCAPFAGWKRYPHAPTYESPDDNGGAPFTDGHDIGVFWADGAGGQFTYVHRGLDLVIVVRDDEAAQANDPEAQRRGESNVTGLEYHRMWRMIRPALVAMDPVFKGDEAAFCEAYRRGAHAPDLLSPWSAESGFGPSRLDGQ